MSLGNTFGLLPTGFAKKSIDDVDADLDAALRAVFGASINTTAPSRFGQLKGIMAERYAELWNLAEVVYGSFDPDQSVGQSLVQLAGLTGTLPVTPTSSVATVTATGTPGTVLAVGKTISVTGTGSKFDTSTGGTITAVSNWANATPYALAARVNTGGKVWQVTHPGTSSTAPTGAQGSTFTDGALVWICLGTGTGAVDLTALSEQTGPIVAAIGSLVTILTPVSGWASVFNVGAAVLGVATEPDAAFRVRREEELRGAGKASVEAIRAALLKVTGVTAATVFENPTDTTNSDGMPPHSIEGLALGGANSDVAEAIFLNKAAGIATTGNQSPVTITDSQGITHSILYSRPVLENIWITVNVLAEASLFPANGAQQIINALLAYGQGLVTDYDVFSSQLAAACLTVSGVLDPGLPLIGLSNPPVSSATIAIGPRQLAVFDQARIVVNVTFGSP